MLTPSPEREAPDIAFYEPDQVTRGHDALNTRVQGLLDEAPGFVFRPSSEPEAIHDLERLSWRFGPDGGAPVVTGTDIALNQLTEEVGGVLNGVTFIFFGAILLGPAIADLSWELALYAALSLTVVRMVLVAIAMLGSQARPPTVGFLGWFGPRGLASIVFAVILIEESQLPHEHLIVLAVYLTVGLSVIAHGLTAAPLANRYAGFERHPRDRTPPMEGAASTVTRTRSFMSQGRSAR